MIRFGAILLGITALAATVFILLVPLWHWPVRSTQVSLNGPSMVQFAPTPQQLTAPNLPPEPLPPAPQVGVSAGAIYKNVQVLKNVQVGEFIRLMTAMTSWVAPKEGCAFCHTANNFAADSKPQKLVARVMLRMTRHINATWQKHVNAAGAGGVTCYTCHRGQSIPSDVFFPSPPHPQRPFIDRQEDWNENAVKVYYFFSRASWQEFLVQDTQALGQSYTALPTGQVASQDVIKRIYEMMMEMSTAIGVNCGFCHNSRAFFDWSQSTPYRWIGYYGISMTRDLNRNFLLPAGELMPQERIIPGLPRMPLLPAAQVGPQPGNALATCGTCHHGVPLPLLGVNVVKPYPELLGPDEQAGVPSPFPPDTHH